MKDVLKLWRKSNALPLRLASASVTQGIGYIFFLNCELQVSKYWSTQKLDKSLSGNILAWLLTEIDNPCIQLGFNWFSLSLPQRSVNCFTDTNSAKLVLISSIHVLLVSKNIYIIQQCFISKRGQWVTSQQLLFQNYAILNDLLSNKKCIHM